MNDIEEMLREKKYEIDNLEVPDELEARLHSALTSSKRKVKPGYRWKLKAAVIIIALAIFTYNMDTLAFYGKKLVGFDTVMNGTLRDLNERGKGQVIEKTVTFANGVTITLNGVMLDDNQLIVFYTIKDPSGHVDDVRIDGPHIKGILGTHHMLGGYGNINPDYTEMKCVSEYQVPHSFEKKLTWVLRDNKEYGEITFVLDRATAMGNTLKSKLDLEMTVDETTIHFDSISASPTVTVIQGTMQDIVELALDHFKGERFYPNHVDLRLLADGKEIAKQGQGIGTNGKGMKLEAKFDALPENFQKLQLQLKSFSADHQVDESIKLEKGTGNKSLEILGQKVEINKVYEENGETFIRITTEDSVLLSRVSLIADKEEIELQETNEQNYEKQSDGTIMRSRTLRFQGTGNELTLMVKGFKYNKVYDKIVDIPIE